MIQEICPNCNNPNLINRPWRDDIFCGWCGSEYKMWNMKLVLVEVHNNHLTERLKEKARKAEVLESK